MFVVTAVVALLLLLWYMPVRLRLLWRQDGKQVDLKLQLVTILLDWDRELNLTDKVQTALDHMLARWRVTGEPVKIPLQKTIRRMPRLKLYKIVQSLVPYTRKRVTCQRLELKALVGAGDAMETALITGASWSAAGAGLGLLSTAVRLEPKVPKLQIAPAFNQVCWRMTADCILKIRLGHAIVAGTLVTYRIVRDREIVAWIRDSLRRKGEEGNERTPDSRPDEDRDGVH